MRAKEDPDADFAVVRRVWFPLYESEFCFRVTP
jgi:hypothetical protein